MPAPRLAVVSTYPPRMCGIASYTADLRAALCAVRPDWEVDIVAVDWDGLSYGDEVVTVVEPVDRASYVRAAGVVADQGTPVVLIQHEYGREYGRSGDNYRHSENLIALAQAASARDLRYAVTLHTVPSRSTEAHRTLLGEMCADAALVTVFTERARRIVEDLDIVAPDRILVVPHGAPPELLSADPEPLRRDLAELDSHGPVLSTFGLLAAPKGLEVAIDAVARLIDRHPTLRYVIAGRTHPEIVRRYGEAYRSHAVPVGRTDVLWRPHLRPGVRTTGGLHRVPVRGGVSRHRRGPAGPVQRSGRPRGDPRRSSDGHRRPGAVRRDRPHHRWRSDLARRRDPTGRRPGDVRIDLCPDSRNGRLTGFVRGGAPDAKRPPLRGRRALRRLDHTS